MILRKKLFIFLGDALALAGSFLITIFISFPNDFQHQINLHTGPFILMYITWLLVIYIFNLYDNHNIRPTVLTLQKIALALLVSGLIGIAMFYLFPIFEITPKSNLIVNLLSFGILFIGWRRICFNIISGQLVEKVAILGTREEAMEIFKTLSQKNSVGYKAVSISNLIDEILAFDSKISKIIIAQNIDTDTLMKITKRGLQTITLLKAYEEVFEKIPVSLMDDNMTVSILSKDKNFFYKLTIRFTSIIVALIIILVTLPITLISGILIKIEDGRKIFYKQKRVGKDSEHFLIWKLQSMKQNAEKNGAVWAEEKDSRITKFGKILRKLHIDEIPQMINVLKGDINLVGPRPERPEFVEKLEKEIPYYFLRHSITPGFTGWAQIKYRYARTVDDSQSKFEYDLYYLKNRNIFLDFGIIIKTIQIIFTH